MCCINSTKSAVLIVIVDQKQSLLRLQNKYFKIVITDIGMPIMNGVELAKNLRVLEIFKT